MPLYSGPNNQAKQTCSILNTAVCISTKWRQRPLTPHHASDNANGLGEISYKHTAAMLRRALGHHWALGAVSAPLGAALGSSRRSWGHLGGHRSSRRGALTSPPPQEHRTSPRGPLLGRYRGALRRSWG
eukprot:2999966-Pyramimonas_sp.AAC.1